MNAGFKADVDYLFIDGGYFRGALKDISKRYYKGIDLLNCIDFNLLGSSYKRVFYYDCLAPKTNFTNPRRI
jgi:hypothetical protein